MKLSIYKIVLLIYISNLAHGQSISTQIGARAAGMGYASSLNYDEWSLFNNPGGIGKLSESSVAFAYEVNPLLEGANRMAFASNASTKWGSMSAGLFRFGDDLYSEQLISTGIGNEFGITSMGLRLNLVQYRSQGFGVWHAVSVDFGGITRLTEQLQIGAYITNINQAKINKDTDERIPTRLTTGLSFKPNDTFIFTSEIAKEIDHDLILRTGIEYSFKNKFFVRTGFNLNPNTGFFGIGGVRKRIKFDYAYQYNIYIRSSHQASATYISTKKKK
jgi:hypothetical protein